MRTTFGGGRWRAVVGLAVALLVVLASAPGRAAAAATLPSSMASTGDSITRGFNTGNLFADAPANSWSTGTAASVNSLYARILATNPGISGRNYNDARTGAKMVDLAGQATTAVSQQVEYVTILMGANDVCTSSVSSMTTVDAFRTQLQSAMATLGSGLPTARVYIVSIPDVYNLWSVFKNNSTARFVWSTYNICQSLLANPTSTKRADVNRRAAVRQRTIDLNAVLAEVCAQSPQCTFDQNAVFNTVFTTADVSTRDYFHPSLAGQAKLAAAAWGASGLQGAVSPAPLAEPGTVEQPAPEAAPAEQPAP